MYNYFYVKRSIAPDNVVMIRPNLPEIAIERNIVKKPGTPLVFCYVDGI
jgi:hypothetical protein